MRSFAYVRDPSFVIACILYASNRWFAKPYVGNLLLHSWFNDALLIPCALPPLLLVHRQLGLRSGDSFPSVSEVGAHWAFWSFLFEGIGPRLTSRATGDAWDILAYALGAVAALLWWRHYSRGS